MNDFGFWVFMLVVLVCFSGEPDLIDRIIWGEGHPVLEEIRKGEGK